MEDIIIKPIEAIDSTASVEENPQRQANPPAQEKIVGPCNNASLAKKPTIPTRPPVRKEIVGPFIRYQAAKKPIAKPTFNPIKDIEAELAEVRKAWARYQSTNGRDVVYFFLAAVFAVVTRWQHFNCALKKSRAALRLQADAPQMKPEPFGIVIFCTADLEVADAKTRSKWSRVLRYARKEKPANQMLTEFIKSNGGINACAGMFARRSMIDNR